MPPADDLTKFEDHLEQMIANVMRLATKSSGRWCDGEGVERPGENLVNFENSVYVILVSSGPRVV